MTEEELKIIEQGYSESKIQHICVTWFRLTFPHLKDILFAVPNGGWRGGRAGATMVYEGQVSGVADLILLYPCGGKGSLCIEMKKPKKKGSRAGTQSDNQVKWQSLVERYGNSYVVCRGLVEFIKSICEYLQIRPSGYIEDALNKYPMYR